MGSYCIRWLSCYIQVVVFKMWGSAYQIAGTDSPYAPCRESMCFMLAAVTASQTLTKAMSD